MSDEKVAGRRIPDPASTFLGAERRDESLFPSAATDVLESSPVPRRWDAASGRWVSHGGPVLPDPSDLPAPTAAHDPQARFSFPKELSSTLPDEASGRPAALQRLLRWLGRFRPDRPR